MPCKHVISKKGAAHLLKNKSSATCPCAGCESVFTMKSLVISEAIVGQIERLKKKEDRKRKRQAKEMSQLEVGDDEEDDDDDDDEEE